LVLLFCAAILTSRRRPAPGRAGRRSACWRGRLGWSGLI